MEQYYKHIAKIEYDLRFQHFLTKLMNISNLYPRDQYLYPLMDKVAFQDLETAMIVAIEEFSHAHTATNDNDKDKGQ